MIVMRSPVTKSKPLEISIGILVKGRKKIGRRMTVKRSARKENLFRRLESIKILY